MEKQIISLQPKQFIIFSPGLKIENCGEVAIRFELPSELIYDVPRFDITKIHYNDRDNRAGL